MKTISAAAAVLALFCSSAGANTVQLGLSGSGQSSSSDQPYTALAPLVATRVPFQNLGSIRFFAGEVVPIGFATADGSQLLINDNEALFSKLDTTYGGDGWTDV